MRITGNENNSNDCSDFNGTYVPLCILNTFMYNLFVSPEGLLIAILLLVGNLFLAYYYRERYKPMLKAKLVS